MARRREDIPGFWFDKEKGKYFKIQPNHVAPQGAKYSKEGVRRERDVEKKRKREAEFDHRQKRARIQRSRIMQHPLGAESALNREIGGLSRKPEEIANQVWLRGIRNTRSLLFYDEVPSQRQIGIRFGIPPSEDDFRITAMVRDESTASILTGACGTHDADNNVVVSWAPDRGDRNELKYSSSGKACMAYERSKVTSLCITPSRFLVSTTAGGPGSTGTVNVTKLLDPELRDTWPVLETGVILRFRLTAPTLSAIWASSPNPDPSNPSIAIGTSGGVLILTASQSGSHDWTESLHKSRSDVFALTWLSNTLLAGGSRDKHVRLYDRRSGGEAVRLKHPSAVNHLRKADEHRLVVAGLENSLHTYDLRYSTFSEDHRQPFTPTEPYISYPDYSNMAHIALGFDVSPSLGLIATGTEDKLLRMFDLWTGKETKAGWGDMKRWAENVSCLSFVGDEESGGIQGSVRRLSKGLLVGSGRVVEEWGW